jgi:hypothetical protein
MAYMAKQDWARLADFVIDRRTQLGMKTRRDLSRVTDINDRTIGKLELGQSVSASTMSTIERALGWAPGSWRRILDGGDPELAEAPARPAARVYTDPVMQEAWEALADVDLPDAVKRGMIAYARAAREDEARQVG